MKKQDLRSGMVVELRDWKDKMLLIDDVFCSTSGENFLELSNYDDNLKHNFNDRFDIIEIYKCKHPNIMSCFLGNKLELIWEREKEINWSKVLTGTKVFVRDSLSEDWNYCKLIEEPKEVTFEEIKKEFDTHCNENRCGNCKYYKENQCEFIYVLDNYNVRRKDI